MARRFALLAAAALTSGCAGSAALLHPVHPLSPGATSAAAGVSGAFAVQSLPAQPAAAPPTAFTLQSLTVAPGVAPYVAARAGLQGDNEGGLTYAGRTVRVDLRHVFVSGNHALSVGLGGSAVLAQGPDTSSSGLVYGGGADIPVLVGWRSTADLYSVWLGPRVGFDYISGNVALGTDANTAWAVRAWHGYAGGVVGLRAGFRHVHAAFEVNAAYHAASGTFDTTSTSVQQVTVTPAGALEVRF